jgi:hypothetical protein
MDPHQSAQPRSTDYRHDDDMRRVMSWTTFLERTSLSKATGNRLRKAGLGPRVVHRSERLLGVTYADEAIWQEARKGQ